METDWKEMAGMSPLFYGIMPSRPGLFVHGPTEALLAGENRESGGRRNQLGHAVQGGELVQASGQTLDRKALARAHGLAA